MTARAQTNGKRPSRLGYARRGFRGRIHAIEVAFESGTLPAGELERRLIELGFTEGALIEILHEGFFGRDPIAVRVNDSTVALRRREAMAIQVI
jgi:ferrous iron transport protein A